MCGGSAPGGITARALLQKATVCAVASAMFVPSWKYTLSIAMPWIDRDSTCSTALTYWRKSS